MNYDITCVRHPLTIRNQAETMRADRSEELYFHALSFNTLILCSPRHTGGAAAIDINEPNQLEGRPVIEIPEVSNNGQ